MRMDDAGLSVIDKLKRLGQYEAVKLVRCDRIGCGQVGDDRRMWVGRVDVEYVTPLDTNPIAISVGAVFNFEHMPTDILALPFEKLLDVIAIDRRASVISPFTAERSRSTDC